MLLYKPNNESYKEQYMRIYKTNFERFYNEAYEKEPSLDTLIISFQLGIPFNNIYIHNVVKYNKLNILKVLEENGIYSDEWTAHYATIFGKINILEWLEQKGILPTEDDATKVMYNSVNILKWYLFISDEKVEFSVRERS